MVRGCGRVLVPGGLAVAAGGGAARCRSGSRGLCARGGLASCLFSAAVLFSRFCWRRSRCSSRSMRRSSFAAGSWKRSSFRALSARFLRSISSSKRLSRSSCSACCSARRSRCSSGERGVHLCDNLRMIFGKVFADAEAVGVAAGGLEHELCVGERRGCRGRCRGAS